MTPDLGRPESTLTGLDPKNASLKAHLLGRLLVRRYPTSHMKTYKACLISLLIIGFTIFVTGAGPSGQDRPEHVRAANWIKVSDTAGVVVGSSSGDKIVGALYVKQGEKWLEVSIENTSRISN
jgi:hypothetical protein